MTLPQFGGNMSQHQNQRYRILTHFSICKDPRKCRIQHDLIDIIVIVVLATLCGEEGWDDFHDWAEERESFLQEFLKLENGIPSADTLRRVIERIDPERFLEAFLAWGNEVSKRLPGQICIDGKSLKKALDAKGALHLVSAFCTENRMVLGSVNAGGKGKEIPAIKELLNSLTLWEGDTITIDAIGCQKEIVRDIRKKKADYLIALKKNQGTLLDEAENFFNQAIESQEYAPCTIYKTTEKIRGREEEHEVWVTEDLDWLDIRREWKDLNQLILVKRMRKQEKEVTVEKRYYIASGKNKAAKIGDLVREHWAIENKYHWHLDVTFGEDASQIGAASNRNLRIARNIALQILKAKPIKGMSYRRQMKRCYRSDNYLRELLLIGNF
jgi:predicted transposase YbfD/YdcC